MLSAFMVLHHLQSQPLSECTPALIVWFMTPAALGDSSINLSKLSEYTSPSFRICWSVSLVELPLCRSLDRLVLHPESEKCSNLPGLLCPTELPPQHSGFCIVVHLGTRHSIWAQGSRMSLTSVGWRAK